MGSYQLQCCKERMLKSGQSGQFEAETHHGHRTGLVVSESDLGSWARKCVWK
jgi:hypothetical protein